MEAATYKQLMGYTSKVSSMSINKLASVDMLKSSCRPHITETFEWVLEALGTRGWGVLQGHFGPSLVKVGSAVVSCYLRKEARLGFSTLQFLPVDGLEPLVASYLIAASCATSHALARLLLKQLKSRKIG